MPSIHNCMPNLVKWEECCGCGACASKCPKLAIRMQPNHEGFLHPMVDKNLCVECGACENVCPGLESALNKEAKPIAYVVQHKDDTIRYQSTSGGAFTAIAEEVIRRDGVVFGAAMTEDLEVKHVYVDDVDGLGQFRNSKYVQSEIGDCYKQAKSLLMKGRWVCFSGTPCQINGLYKFLGKDYERLIAVDVVCKSVPSPLVFKKYVQYKKEKEGELTDVVFRDKKRGFLYCTMAHYLSHNDRMTGKDVYRRGSESDEWLRLFLSGIVSRRSCMTCPYQTVRRVGDFTLGDIWEIGDANLDDNKGTTLVHVWTQKGRIFLNGIMANLRLDTYPIEKSRGIVRKNTLTVTVQRKMLFEDVKSLSSDAFFVKYAPYSMTVRLKNDGRYLLWRLGLQNIVRHAKHILIHR